MNRNWFRTYIYQQSTYMLVIVSSIRKKHFPDPLRDVFSTLELDRGKVSWDRIYEKLTFEHPSCLPKLTSIHPSTPLDADRT